MNCTFQIRSTAGSQKAVDNLFKGNPELQFIAKSQMLSQFMS